MLIKIFNHTKLTATPFFQTLIDFLASHDDVTLRKIKAAFTDVTNIERQIENFVQAGFIAREDKRYTNNFKVYTDSDVDYALQATQPETLVFEQPFFVAAKSELATKLAETRVQQTLANQTNSITLHFSSNFLRQEDNLANYFYHVAQRVALSPLEQQVFQLIGDVDPEYALKYMTTFLLKFLKKDIVKNKKPDIFVQALILFDYLKLVDEDNYQIMLAISEEQLPQVTFDDAGEFIAAQLRQTQKIDNFMSL